MLKNLNPLLTPELLWVLRSMGHGDDLCVCDANFPAQSIAGSKHLIRLQGVGIAPAVRAILSVMPLDSFVEKPARRMAVDGKPDYLTPAHQEVQREIDAAEGKSWPMGPVERFAFYEEAKNAFAVVATQEMRGYACFLFKKGVILATD